jgi:RNA polymerase sigma factor (sigma-70 family)
MTPDNELLRRYTDSRSEEAFAELVRRHIDLVYSAALRQVGSDAHHAQDVAQTVFTDLARKAAPLSRRQSLTGWLYTSAHFAAAKIARTESRRRDREEKFMSEPSHDTSPNADWEKLRPTLDAAMHELKEVDREALLLRYFENHPFAEVGARLSVNENTARMRVERAVEKLRGLLAKRGITTGAALASVISANAVQMAPASFSGSLATVALGCAGTGAFAFFQTMNMTTLKLGLGTLATAGVIAALVVQLHAQKSLRAENESLSGQIAQLKTENAELSNQIAASTSSLATQKEQSNELLKLRAEVTQLRTTKTASPMAAAMSATNNLPVTNKTAISLKLKFVSLSTRSAQNLGAGWLSASGDTSILSEQEVEAFNKALHREANSTTESEITTFSGREAAIGAQQPVSVNGTNANVGMMLDVLPRFISDASLFTLNVAAKMDQSSEVPSQPAMQTILASNQVTLSLGQTMALKAQMPPDGWLPRTGDLATAPTAPDGPSELLFFVTPKLVEIHQQNEASASNTSPDAASQSETRQAEAMQKANLAKQGVLALIMFANDNEQQFPANLQQASRYIKDDTMSQIEANFDFIDPGSITNVPQPSTTIVLKEKQPWQTPDGSWRKTYGFADGHSEIHLEPNGDFTEFENRHTKSVTANP